MSLLFFLVFFLRYLKTQQHATVTCAVCVTHATIFQKLGQKTVLNVDSQKESLKDEASYSTIKHNYPLAVGI